MVLQLRHPDTLLEAGVGFLATERLVFLDPTVMVVVHLDYSMTKYYEIIPGLQESVGSVPYILIAHVKSSCSGNIKVLVPSLEIFSRQNNLIYLQA